MYQRKARFFSTPDSYAIRVALTWTILIFGPGLGAIQAQSRHTLSGYIREAGSGELLPGVNIYVKALQSGVSSNKYGFYSLSLASEDSVEVIVSAIGYQAQSIMVSFRSDQQRDISLSPESTELQEIVIEAERSERISQNPLMSVVSVPIQQVKKLPAFMGEKDVFKVLQLMPGVQNGREGNAGLYVRGGGPDQNLIILDDATVYSAFHLFGFFSLFNGDAVKSVELTKGGFPARFGGRLSSVVEMQMKEGSKEALHGEAGIGLISSRLTLEGPIQKGKSSFLLSGRRTYADLLIRPFMPANENGRIYFYDLNAKLNYELGRKHKLYLSSYFGRDVFAYRSNRENDFTGETQEDRGGFNWGNATATLRWNHLYNDKLFGNASFIFSNFGFRVFAEENVEIESPEGIIVQKFNLEYLSRIRDFSLKYDLDFFPGPAHHIRAGLLATAHRFKPSALTYIDTAIDSVSQDINPIETIEAGVYVEDSFQPFKNLRLNAGLRWSFFAVEDRLYHNPEPRLSVAYTFTGDWALKSSYALMNQYIHLLSNSGLGLPSDLWVPTTRRVPFQRSQQVALGIAKDLPGQNLTLSLEGYYKDMDQVIGYREGANFLFLEVDSEEQEIENIDWESNLTSGQAWAYGAEILLQRKTGRLSGWIGYTLSWAYQQFEEVNFGKKFHPRYDRRHDLSVVAVYELKPNITLSGTWVFGTGNAITIPLAKYNAEEYGPPPLGLLSVRAYGERNDFRMAPYHRLDLSIQFHKKKKRGERTWEISIYNAYSRANPFYYDLASSRNPETGVSRRFIESYALFPIIPSASYNFKF